MAHFLPIQTQFFITSSIFYFRKFYHFHGKHHQKVFFLLLCLRNNFIIFIYSHKYNNEIKKLFIFSFFYQNESKIDQIGLTIHNQCSVSANFFMGELFLLWPMRDRSLQNERLAKKSQNINHMHPTNILQALRSIQIKEESIYIELGEYLLGADIKVLQKYSPVLSMRLSQCLSEWEKEKNLKFHQKYLPNIMNTLYSRINEEGVRGQKFSILNQLMTNYKIKTDIDLEILPLKKTKYLFAEKESEPLNKMFMMPTEDKKSSNINKDIENLTKYNCLFPGSCLACNDYFYDSWEFERMGEEKYSVVGMRQFEKEQFLKKIQSVIEKEGGFVLVNPRPEENKLAGTVFSKIEKQKIIQKAKSYTDYASKQNYTLSLNFVLVERAPELPKDERSSKQTRLIPRLTILPQNEFEIENKAMDQEKKKKHSFEGKILCVEPIKTKQHCEKTYYRINQTMAILGTLTQPKLEFDFKNGYPKFEKKYQSMLFLHKQKGVQMFEKFKSALDENSYQWSLTKPFPSNKDEEIRDYYLFCHEEPLDTIQKMKKKFDPYDNVQIILVQNHLRITRMNHPIKFKIFVEYFKEYFQDIFYIKERHIENKWENYKKRTLAFKKKQHAIFGFLYFQHVGVGIKFVSSYAV